MTILRTLPLLAYLGCLVPAAALAQGAPLEDPATTQNKATSHLELKPVTGASLRGTLV